MTVPRSALLVAISMLAAPVGTASAQPRGLGQPQGLGAPRGLGGATGLLTVDPKAAAMEKKLLEMVNKLRTKKKLAPLEMNKRLQTFMRQESMLAAKGDPTAPKIHDRVKGKGYAPYGYMLQAAYGNTADELFKRLKKDKNMAKAMYEEYARAGVGAFWVPAEPPYFQVMLIIAQEPDPMAGKTGLTKAQTDPVMRLADLGVKSCYQRALKRNPNIGGIVQMKITIGGGGAVTDTLVTSSLKDVDFDVCLMNTVRALKFPAPYKNKPVNLNHPFKFSPPQGSRRLGTLSDTQLNSVFTRARAPFRRCYDDRLEAKPGLGGKMVLALTVMPSGDSTKVRLSKDTIKDLVLARCILDLAKELRFPKPKHAGEVDVTYPLSFSPPKGK